jgi:hypothetical protein
MAAFLMAAVLQGMSPSETAAMTRAFVASGAIVELGDVGRAVVDKHSTGGVADAVSLVFAPLIASLGLACVKISGGARPHRRHDRQARVDPGIPPRPVDRYRAPTGARGRVRDRLADR